MPPRWFRILVFLFALATYGSTVRAQSTLIPLSNGMSEMVFDHSGTYLYVTVPGGLVRRYNLTTHQFDLDYNLGGSVSSIDIAPDDSCLLVTQDIPANAQGIVHRIDLRTGAVVNLSYDLINYPNYEVGAWVVRIASNGLAFVIGNLYGLAGGTVPLRQIDLATNTISVRSDVDWPMFASDISRSADATVLYITEPQVSNNPVLTYDAKTNSFSAVISTNLTLFYNTNAVSRDGTLLATTLLDYGVSLDRFSNFSYVHNFPPAPETSLESSVVFDPKSDTMYWVRSSTQQIVAYDTNTFAEKFRWDIGEWVGGASGYWVPFVASPDGRYLALGTQSGIRLFSLPGPTEDRPGFVDTVRYRKGMVFDHDGSHLYVGTNVGLIQQFTVPDGQLDQIYNVGGSASGMDLSPDGSYLLVAQGNPGVATGAFQRIDLNSGAISNILYSRNYNYEWDDAGAWDVKIASNGLAFGDIAGGSGGLHRLRQINLNTNEVVARREFGDSMSVVQLVRSNDRNRVFILGGPVIYNAVTDTFSNGNAFIYVAQASSANQDGTLFANLQIDGVKMYSSPDFTLLHTFSLLDSGIVFDPNQSVIYGVSSATDEIIAYDTNSYSELFRIPIGEDLQPNALQNQPGSLIASPDGRYLALYTPKDIRLIDLATHTASPMNVPTLFSAYTSVEPPDAGTATGSGHYPRATMVTVTTTINPGFEFENWSENGVILSTNPSYQFAIDDNRSLIANFERIVITPTISPNGGTFKKKVTVQLSCATPGATILYTLDGTDPTILSSVYQTNKKNKGIKITGRGLHTIKAKGVEGGIKDSAIATATFTIN